MENNDVIQFDVPHRVHSSYIWLGAIRTFILVFGIIVASSPSLISGVVGISKAPGVSERISINLPLIIIAVILAILISYAIALLYHFVSYKHISYTISKDDLLIKRGVFIKKNFHIPYARIQTVDLSSSFLQRIVGVSDVSIDTAGGSSNERIKIPFVRQTNAEVLRLLIFTLKKVALNGATFDELETVMPKISSFLDAPESFSKSATNVMDFADNIMSEMGSIVGGRGIADEKTSASFGLKNFEVFLSAISGKHTLICFGLIMASIYVLSVLQNYIPAGVYSGNDVVIDFVSNFFENSFAIITSLIVGVTIIATWLSITVADAFNNAGFECRRKGTRLEVEHGLFQHSTQALDIDKIQEIKVKQGLLRQIIGYASISALTITSNAGGSDEEKRRASTGVLLHPFIKLSRVENVISDILPEFEFCLNKEKRVAHVALRRSIIRDTIVKNIGFWYMVAYFVFCMTCEMFVDQSLKALLNEQLHVLSLATIPVCVAIMVLGFVDGIVWYKSSSFDYTDAFIQITKGGFHRSFVSIPRKRVQWIYTSRNPFQRRVGTSTLNIRTAAGSGGTTTRLIDLAASDAEMCLTWIKPKSNT